MSRRDRSRWGWAETFIAGFLLGAAIVVGIIMLIQLMVST